MPLGGILCLNGRVARLEERQDAQAIPSGLNDLIHDELDVLELRLCRMMAERDECEGPELSSCLEQIAKIEGEIRAYARSCLAPPPDHWWLKDKQARGRAALRAHVTLAVVLSASMKAVLFSDVRRVRLAIEGCRS